MHIYITPRVPNNFPYLPNCRLKYDKLTIHGEVPYRIQKYGDLRNMLTRSHSSIHSLYISMGSVKAVTVEDKTDLRSKNKIKKGVGREECLCNYVKKASDLAECQSMREGGRVSKAYSIIKIIFVTKLAKSFFCFVLIF